jgi:hypothetical protein
MCEKTEMQLRKREGTVLIQKGKRLDRGFQVNTHYADRDGDGERFFVLWVKSGVPPLRGMGKSYLIPSSFPLGQLHLLLHRNTVSCPILEVQKRQVAKDPVQDTSIVAEPSISTC